jgi:hypothetical protein
MLNCGIFSFWRQDTECILRSLRRCTVLNAFVVIATCIFLCSSSIVLRARASLMVSVYRRVVVLYKVLFPFENKKSLYITLSVASAQMFALNRFLFISLSLPHPTDTGPS